MNKPISRHTPTALALALFLGSVCIAQAQAQVAGVSTTVEAVVTESVQLAQGWSVKKTLMGKTVYDDAGQKVGKVTDLIVSPDRNVSFVIVGAGGFVGIGRHDVAVPVTQIQDQAGKLVMPGATRDSIKSMPEFNYLVGSITREQFVAAANKDIAKGKAKVAELDKRAAAAAADAKGRIEKQKAEIQADLTTADAKLTEMNTAAAARWKEFEAGVSAATARLRKSIETAVG